MRAYPFSAVVGSDDMALALLLAAVAPEIGGVLVRGEKGTAKTTMVRGLAAVLPPIAVVPGCRFSCDPADPDPGCPDGPHPAAHYPTDPYPNSLDPRPVDPSACGSQLPEPSARGAQLPEPSAPSPRFPELTAPTPDAASATRPPRTSLRPTRLVELPVGASEDRVVGALDLQRVLGAGQVVYEPGLLAAAHRGILYVDEVNLLHDHLVDLLLDAAATGRSTVEREGVSVAHASRIVLVGTMNPEEGELRPQLLDRFGLTVEIAAPHDPALRVQVVRRRMAYDADPDGFAATYGAAEEELRARVVKARSLIGSVTLSDAHLTRIAEVCAAFEVDGMRADLVTARAAAAHAAWHGRDTVTLADIRAAARLALPHRRRRNPFDAPGLDEDLLDRLLGDHEPDPSPDPSPEFDGSPPEPPGEDSPPDPDSRPGDPDPSEGSTPAPEREPAPASGPPAGDPAPAPTGPTSADPEPPPDPALPAEPPPGPTQMSRVAADAPYRTRMFAAAGVGRGEAGRRSRALTSTGRTVGAARPTPGSPEPGRLHLPATLRAAAAAQQARGRTRGPLRLAAPDLRRAVTEGRESNLVLLVVDASGSMAARKRMAVVKTAVLSLLTDAYQRRDKVGLVTFGGSGADLALPPTTSIEVAARRLNELPTGGRTPLAEGLLRAAETLRIERIRDPRRRPLLVLVTDGRATAGPNAVTRSRQAANLLRRTGVSSVVLDCETGRLALGLARTLSVYLDADYLRIDQVAAGPAGSGPAGSGPADTRVGGMAAETITGAVRYGLAARLDVGVSRPGPRRAA